MANIYSLQLLRNGTPFTSYTAAVNAITGDTTRQDGILKLARYTSTTETSGTAKYNTATVKTVFGLYYKPESGEGSWTIFDSYHEVIQNIQDQIDSLTGGAGSIAQQIQAALDQLDFAGVTGNVVTQVTQTNGLVAASGANVGNLVLTDYAQGTDSGDVVSTDSINVAIAKLQNQVKALDAEKDADIAALDYTDTAVTGSYVSAVDEADGVISVTRVALPSAGPFAEAGKPIIAVEETLGEVSASAGTINAEFVNVTGNTFSSTTVQGALEEIETEYKAADAALKTEILGDATESGNTLGKLEDRIEALDADAKEYALSSVTPSSTNVKEAYALFDADGHQSGATINIYKDSAYKEIYLGTSADTINATTGDITKQGGDKQSLNYAYMKADGTYDLVKVDVSAFLSESEFQSGVTATDHIVHGVVDPTSETFLTVGANGFKLAGVQQAINDAQSNLQNALDALSGKTVTGIDMTGGTASIAAGDNGTKKITINADGSTLSASTNYTSAQTASAVAAGDSIDTALGKLEAQVAAARAAATTKVEKDANASHITLTSNTAADGSVTYTIGEDDIASATALTAETAARKAVDGQNGDTYAANTSANYISAATSLNDADVKLDAAIKALEGAAQTEIDAIETAVGLNNDGTYNANTSNTYTNNATSVADAVDKLDAAVKDNADAIDALEGAFVSGATMNGTAVTKANNALAFTASYTNEAANSTEGMVITTDGNGGLDFKFGTLDAGTY